MAKKKQIVDLENKRYGLFMTQKSFDLDVMYGRNFLKTDNVQTVLIHRINIIETKAHSLYGQAKAKDKKYLAPVELSVMITIEDGVQLNYGDEQTGIVRDDSGNIKFGVYLKELEEKKIDLKRGDIIEYNMSGTNARFYELENANNVVDITSKTIGGFAPYYRVVTGVPVKSDITPFLNDTKGN